MNMEQLLLKLGCVTWTQDIVTQISTSATATQQIGNVMAQNVGFIYGLSIYVDCFLPDNTPSISTAQAQQLYLNLKTGSTEFIQSIRLDDMVTLIAGVVQPRETRYLPVSIPSFDLSKSQYANPTLTGAGNFIALKLWFINNNDWARVKGKLGFEHEPNKTPEQHKR